MANISIEQGWSAVIPFTVFGADGVTPDTGYVVPPADLTSADPASVRVALQPDNRSFQADALGGTGANVHLITRVGAVVHNTTQLISVTAPVDRSGSVIGTPGPPFRTPAA